MVQDGVKDRLNSKARHLHRPTLAAPDEMCAFKATFSQQRSLICW